MRAGLVCLLASRASGITHKASLDQSDANHVLLPNIPAGTTQTMVRATGDVSAKSLFDDLEFSLDSDWDWVKDAAKDVKDMSTEAWKDTKSWVSSAWQKLEDSFDDAKCIICEDGAKFAGYAIQAALMDDDGIGEAESAAIYLAKKTAEGIVEVVGEDLSDALDQAVCRAQPSPIDTVVDAISDADKRINNQELKKCAQEICTNALNQIMKTLGQALVAELLTIIAALLCKCAVPFHSCWHIFDLSKTPGPNATLPPPNIKALLHSIQEKAMVKFNTSTAMKNRAKQIMLFGTTASQQASGDAADFTPASKACMIDEWHTASAANLTPCETDVTGQCLRPGMCMSNLDCQGERTCARTYTGVTDYGPWWCNGTLSPDTGCCPTTSSTWHIECPTQSMVTSITDMSLREQTFQGNALFIDGYSPCLMEGKCDNACWGKFGDAGNTESPQEVCQATNYSVRNPFELTESNANRWCIQMYEYTTPSRYLHSSSPMNYTQQTTIKPGGFFRYQCGISCSRCRPVPLNVPPPPPPPPSCNTAGIWNLCNGAWCLLPNQCNSNKCSGFQCK